MKPSHTKRCTGFIQYCVTRSLPTRTAPLLFVCVQNKNKNHIEHTRRVPHGFTICFRLTLLTHTIQNGLNCMGLVSSGSCFGNGVSLHLE